eukprot:1341052-Pyramimonas_sp.AAC.4
MAIGMEEWKNGRIRWSFSSGSRRLGAELNNTQARARRLRIRAMTNDWRCYYNSLLGWTRWVTTVVGGATRMAALRIGV